MMTYPETLEFLLNRLPMFQRIGPAAFKKDLTNTLRLLEALDHPQRSFRSVHIAGTNGKGSVSHMLAAVLQKEGYKVGLYTSPHYKDIRERIKVNGILMEADFLVAFVDKMMPLIEEIQPSYFELLVAMSFDYFRYTAVDWAVVEVGLGGRLDSTNVISPELCVITNISYDHMNMLGDTLEEIAGEKAGIIKQGIPVLIGERQVGLDRLFEVKAEAAFAPISFASDAVQITSLPGESLGQMHIQIQHEDQLIGEGVVDVFGDYQLKNIATAFAASHQLADQGILKSPLVDLFFDALKALRKDWQFIGRMQVLGAQPYVLADSAHNEAGIDFLIQALDRLNYEKLHIVFGTVNDKDPGKVLQKLPTEASYYFCKPNIPRGHDAEELARKAANLSLSGSAYASCVRAYEAALGTAEPEDFVLICGSIFVVAELIF